jgi:carbohydrate kinase (thermoresistant glucokinase family)
MGVSASGKSTVASRLAVLLRLPWLDADVLHSESNIAKMSSGRPLTDEDRWPWLDAVGSRLKHTDDCGQIIACSALRRCYRDRIRRLAPDTVFVHLHGSAGLLSARAQSRTGHFMPPDLLSSQIALLERLEPDEKGLTVDVGDPLDVIVQKVSTWLNLGDVPMSRDHVQDPLFRDQNGPHH